MTTISTVAQLDEMITRPCERVKETLRRCPGRITVLGAGGKMGFHLCRMLQRALDELGRKDQLLAVSRFSSVGAEQPFQQAGIATHTADLSQGPQVRSIPTTPFVFFLAGVKFGTADNPELLTKMNSEMPKLIAGHFSDSAIVAMSTGCVYSFADQSSGGSRETDPTDPPGEYAQSCLDRETAFVNGSLSHHTKCCLIRLNYSIDLRYGVLLDIAQHVWENRPVNIETGYVNVIWQGDAIKQIIQAATLTESPPQVINVTGSEILSVRDIATGFGKRLDRVPKFSGLESPNCWLSSNAKACEMFGQPSTSIEQMMDWTSDWISTGGPTLNKPTHFQNRDGNY